MGQSTYHSTGVISWPDIRKRTSSDSIAWILDPDEFPYRSVELDLFLVVIVARDTPGIVRQALIALEALGMNVVASLSGSHSDVGACALVVSGGKSSSPEGRHTTSSLIEQTVKEQVGKVVPTMREDGASVTAHRVTGPNERALFAGRAFGEVRFGPFRDQGVDNPQQIASLVGQFASLLAAEGIPIAYFDIGHRWRALERYEGEARWLRVAYAPETVPGGNMLAEFAAYRAAADHNLASYVHVADPDRPLSESFAPVHLPEPQGSLVSDLIGGTYCVVIESTARVGFVAEVLAAAAEATVKEAPFRIFGGAMMVLYGRSVLMLLTDDAGKRALDTSVRQVERRSGTTRTIRIQPADPKTSSRVRGRTFWVAWRCADTPGLFRRILEDVYDFLYTLGVTDSKPNVVFAISRVLSPGSTCAGKVKLALDPVATEDVTLDLHALQERLRRTIADQVRGWSAPSKWQDDPVFVTENEPDETPWATLDGPTLPVS